MSAKEMFEKSGYFFEEYNGYIRYLGVRDREVLFDITDKHIRISDDGYDAIWIGVEELNAINKQVKELGWLNEK